MRLSNEWAVIRWCIAELLMSTDIGVLTMQARGCGGNSASVNDTTTRGPHVYPTRRLARYRFLHGQPYCSGGGGSSSPLKRLSRRRLLVFGRLFDATGDCLSVAPAEPSSHVIEKRRKNWLTGTAGRVTHASSTGSKTPLSVYSALTISLANPLSAQKKHAFHIPDQGRLSNLAR